MELKQLQKESYEYALIQGFWEEPINIPEKLCLIHSELSEALEEFRGSFNPTLYYDEKNNMKPEGFGVELADAIIRILDLAEFLNIDIEEMIKIKMNYNKGREYKHGKKC